jgi:hypothetical protein
MESEDVIRRLAFPQSTSTDSKSGKSRRIIFLLFIIAIVVVVAVSGIFWADLYPAPGTTTTADGQWVAQFITIINQQRKDNGSAPLQPAGNLSQFAAIRFQNTSTHYYFPNYGFVNESTKFFGSSRDLVTEDSIFPAHAPPS